jgi:hypothetical protein
MTTANSVRRDVQNALDFLGEAELASYTRPVVVRGPRVSWPSTESEPFLISREHPDIDQYLAWVSAGAYSAALYEGSLIQITYDVVDGAIAGHRLAYIPCPYLIDPELLKEGNPLVDVVELYRAQDPLMRSPIRFDFDPDAASAGHPEVHLTLNSPDCRIACAAPIHVLRFLDFVFRQFYTSLWNVHQGFFNAAAWRHAGSVATLNDPRALHVSWDVNASEDSSVAS